MIGKYLLDRDEGGKDLHPNCMFAMKPEAIKSTNYYFKKHNEILFVHGMCNVFVDMFKKD